MVSQQHFDQHPTTRTPFGLCGRKPRRPSCVSLRRRPRRRPRRSIWHDEPKGCTGNGLTTGHNSAGGWGSASDADSPPGEAAGISGGRGASGARRRGAGAGVPSRTAAAGAGRWRGDVCARTQGADLPAGLLNPQVCLRICAQCTCICVSKHTDFMAARLVGHRI